MMILTVALWGCRMGSEGQVSEGQGASVSGQAADAQMPGVEEIVWVTNLDEGLKLAQESNKPVMVDFYADWCGWCKKLDKDVYTDRQVKVLAKNYISVKVDTDKNPADAGKYGVQGLPTILFLEADGNAINRVVGYQPAPEFAKTLQTVLDSRRPK